MPENKRIWPRPVMIPEPCRVAGISQPVISLAGMWKLNTDPVDGFWQPSVDPSSWQDIEVPSTLTALGIRVPNKHEYAYKTNIHIPEDFAGSIVKIRFDAVNCLARVWVDGHFIRSHWGGFNAWDADITAHVKAGCSHELTVGVADQFGVASQFHLGGIIRDARLIAVPRRHLERVHVQTDFDGEYRDATLRVMVKVSCGGAGEDVSIKLALTGPGGETVDLGTNMSVDAGASTGVDAGVDAYAGAGAGVICVPDGRDVEAAFPIACPMKWDAEHPNLYMLESELSVGGEVIETYSQNIGFRVVERREDQVFVNGREIKLRGVNREEIHPLKGRTISKEDIEADVRLFKEANVNFVRTSHYNPSKYFLDLCDKYGIYVEEENSLSFVGQGQDQVHDDPAFLAHFIDQYAEMIEKDRSHPSIIMWSFANESTWGDNFRAMLEYTKQEDPSRLTIFSYPVNMQQEDEMVDIWSAHYNHWYSPANLMSDNSSLGGWKGKHAYPVLHDEYIHVSCYNRSELRRDEGSRDFWGESIKRFWDKIYDTKGALGAAIWGGIDEVWFCRDHPDSTSEWGIIDGYRRKKPEFWLTKRGYSPIRIETSGDGANAHSEPGEENAHSEPSSAMALGNPGHDAPLRVSVYNRYNHTNLNELTIRWSVGGSGVNSDMGSFGEICGPDAEPGHRGCIELPKRPWRDDDVVSLAFIEPSGLVCDEFRLPLTARTAQLPELSGKAPVVSGEAGVASTYGGASVSSASVEPGVAIVSGEGFVYRFNRATGMLSLEAGGEKVIKSGPHLNLVGLALAPWQCSSFKLCEDGGAAMAVVKGCHGKVSLTYRIAIDAEGLMRVSYTIDDMPYAPPRRQTMGYGVDVGGYSEVGITFALPSGVDRLSWDKDGLWDYYPDDHIGRREGTAKKLRGDHAWEEPYRHAPAWDWKEDMRNHALFGQFDMGGRGTKDFVTSKSRIYSARAYRQASRYGVEVLSDGGDSVRMQLAANEHFNVDDRDPRVEYFGSWQKYDDKYGCYKNTETRSNIRGDYAQFAFTGTGVCWIAKKHVMYGMADVYIDGKPAPHGSSISLMRMGGSGAIRGDERAYGEMAYTIEGLPYGKHTIKVAVAGAASDFRGIRSSNAYVSIDAFVVLGGHLDGDVLMHINGQYNYPELSWGTYMKDAIKVETGYTDEVYIRPYKASYGE
ncbi:MAG: hypothetical protein FWH01_06335 [Oscillospiraceae bacterium]|nr:hypothetical protein [Oscillospiraceae bacterium]